MLRLSPTSRWNAACKRYLPSYVQGFANPGFLVVQLYMRVEECPFDDYPSHEYIPKCQNEPRRNYKV